MNILLVEPNFPTPNKSKNHKNFLPIGLLKLASYYRKKCHNIELIQGNRKPTKFKTPHRIEITSLFTYWSKYVWDSVRYYRKKYPKAKIRVGGIYATLMHEHLHFKTRAKRYKVKAFVGLHKEAEKCIPAYDLVDVDYQIIHASRGCMRKCLFCGTWKIEPRLTYKKSIKKEIIKNKLIFYDNNILRNPRIKNILREIAGTKVNGRAVSCESQSGFDARLLVNDPGLAALIKKARFRDIRIAWDHGFEQKPVIEKAIDILVGAGYNRKDIFIFMLYNFELTFEELEAKREQCLEWGVQIADCRYRPLDQTFDNYDPRAKNGQTSRSYYIHPNWTDTQVRQFRKNVREQNIAIRLDLPKRGLRYDARLERMGVKRRAGKTITGYNELIAQKIPVLVAPQIQSY